MAHTTFTNGVTLTEATWFQDVDTVAYTLFGNGTSYTGVLTLAGTTQSTSTTTGQAIISGGMGLAKNLWVGGTGNFAGTLTLSGTAANLQTGANFISYDGTDAGLSFDSSNNATFSVKATATAFVPSGSTVPTNGMYLSAANTLAWATGSSLVMSLSPTGALLTVGAQTVSNTFPKMILKRSNSATAYGSLDFVGSDDAVDWQIATNNAIGSQGFEINGADGSSNFLFLAPTTGYLKVIGVYSQTSGSAANVVVDSSGNVMRSTSVLSKKNLRDDLTLAEARVISLGNRALRYTMKDSSDETEYIGYGAELVAKKDSRMVTFDKEGNPDGIQYPAYAVPHGMILDDHESRLKAIEAKLGIQ